MVNPVIIAVTGIFAVFISAIVSYISLPIEDEFYQKNQNLSSTRAQEVSEVQHNLYVLALPAFVGGIFLAIFLRAGRRSADEFEE